MDYLWNSNSVTSFGDPTFYQSRPGLTVFWAENLLSYGTISQITTNAVIRIIRRID